MQDEITYGDFYEDNLQDKKIFAFPYGSIYACTKESILFVQKSGYDMSFSTIAARCNRKWFEKNKWFLPRINVNEKNFIKVIR